MLSKRPVQLGAAAILASSLAACTPNSLNDLNSRTKSDVINLLDGDTTPSAKEVAPPSFDSGDTGATGPCDFISVDADYAGLEFGAWQDMTSDTNIMMSGGTNVIETFPRVDSAGNWSMLSYQRYLCTSEDGACVTPAASQYLVPDNTNPGEFTVMGLHYSHDYFYGHGSLSWDGSEYDHTSVTCEYSYFDDIDGTGQYAIGPGQTLVDSAGTTWRTYSTLDSVTSPSDPGSIMMVEYDGSCGVSSTNHVAPGVNAYYPAAGIDDDMLFLKGDSSSTTWNNTDYPTLESYDPTTGANSTLLSFDIENAYMTAGVGEYDLDGDGTNEDDVMFISGYGIDSTGAAMSFACASDLEEPLDSDGDGIPNDVDDDDDNDGYLDDEDAFPLDESEWLDTDGDGVGNNADEDDDNDGHLDEDDAFPLDESEWSDLDGDGIGDNTDTDRDGDGYDNDADAFPDDSSEWLDTDGDGIGNNADEDDDNDGFSDLEEEEAGTDPLDENSYPTSEDTGIQEDTGPHEDTGTPDTETPDSETPGGKDDGCNGCASTNGFPASGLALVLGTAAIVGFRRRREDELHLS